MQFIAYCRVSTSGQGESGLGLESQQDYIKRACESNGWTVVDTIIETASGKTAPLDRPGLTKALQLCKQHGCGLLVAKLDRLSRRVLHLEQLKEAVTFKVATMPHADNLQLVIFAALAQQEAEFIAQRTSDALSQLQARADRGDSEALQKIENRRQSFRKVEDGGKGNYAAGHDASLKVRQMKAAHHAQLLEDAVLACKARGLTTLKAVADCLNLKGHRTSRGGEFSSMQVSRLLKQLNITL